MYLEALHVMYALRNVNRPSEECKEIIQLGSWPSGEIWETTQSGQVATQPSGECRETAAAKTDTPPDRIENAAKLPQRSHSGQPTERRTQENHPTIGQPSWWMM